jgi:hypothetical protein
MEPGIQFPSVNVTEPYRPCVTVSFAAADSMLMDGQEPLSSILSPSQPRATSTANTTIMFFISGIFYPDTMQK